MGFIKMYKGIKEAVLSGETTPSSRGKRIILPSSFTGGPRYMIQNYQDAIAIYKVVGYLDLFIRFTCNSKWPEVKDIIKNGELNAEDRPDIVCRAFKAKLDILIKDIRVNKIFGRVSAAEDIDKIISVEIPDKNIDPRFVECTTVDDDGYPVYRRREDGSTTNKSGVDLDNHYVVPHNRLLLMRYDAHINVEWYNQSRLIKYLFKYVNKGYDRIIASFYKSAIESAELDEYDEVSMYYDCRYISPCEAAWRIFGFNIQYRDKSVMRLGFHLSDEQNANKDYIEARSLTYVELPTKFVWKANERMQLPRKSHSVIGRIFYVPPRSGKSYYLRLLLNYVKGATSYEEIRTLDGVMYATFKDACYARGLLDNDKEYVDAIKEANHWDQEHI
ncbi:uncharacterized protein [Arachis hypogaea]|uniref:uncharacterized protein n=1 Tax=Arachis hypogaea TaxID=3818 RepID=UPI000DECDA3D